MPLLKRERQDDVGDDRIVVYPIGPSTVTYHVKRKHVYEDMPYM